MNPTEPNGVGLLAPPVPEVLVQPPSSAAPDTGAGSPPALGKRFFNLRTLISFAIGFGILLFLLTRVQLDVGAILDRVRQANPWLLLAAFVAFYTVFPFRALRWRLLLRNVGFYGLESVRLPNLFGLSEIILLGWFANCIVPAKLGDAYRAYLLRKDAGVSFTTTIGTVVAERILDVLVLFILMVVAASLAFGQALPPQVVLLMQFGLALAAIVVIGLVALKNLRPLALRAIPNRFHDRYHALEHGVLASFRQLPAIGALTCASWAGEVARLYLVTLALGVTGVAPSVILFVALASALATALPLTPAGLGIAEGTIVTIFLLAANSGLAPGVDQQTAASIALLDRVISYWSLVVIGFVAYLLSKRT